MDFEILRAFVELVEFVEIYGFCLDFDLYPILHQHVYCLESRSVHNASELVKFKSCFLLLCLSLSSN